MYFILLPDLGVPLLGTATIIHLLQIFVFYAQHYSGWKSLTTNTKENSDLLSNDAHNYKCDDYQQQQHPDHSQDNAQELLCTERKPVGMIIFYCNTCNTTMQTVINEQTQKIKTKFEMKAFCLLVSFCRLIFESTAKWPLLGSQLDMFR